MGGGEIVCGVEGAGECGAIGRFGLGGFESVEIGTEADDGTHVSPVWTRAECQALTSTLSCASNMDISCMSTKSGELIVKLASIPICKIGTFL